MFRTIVGFLAKNLDGSLQLLFPRSRKSFAGAIDEILDHANTRSDSFGTHFLAGHDARDGFRILGEGSFRWIRRHCFDFLNPGLLSHDSLLWPTSSAWAARPSRFSRRSI